MNLPGNSWLVYDSREQLKARCYDLRAAADLVCMYGECSTIRWGSRTVLWTEGMEAHSAHGMYDRVVEHCQNRMTAIVQSRHRAKQNKPIPVAPILGRGATLGECG